MKTHFTYLFLTISITFLSSIRVLAQDNFPSARIGHSMVAIDSLIYVFGGESIESTKQKAVLLNDIHKHDSVKDEWLPELPINELPTGRKNHSSTTYNGKIFIFGGQTSTGYTNEIWQYSPANQMWEQITITGDNIAARADHAAVQVDEFLYIAGGHDDTQLFYNAYRINVNTGVCEQLPNPTAYDFNGPNGKAGVNVQGTPYFFGGWDEEYAYLNIAAFISDGNYWSYRYGCPVAGYMGASVVSPEDPWVYLLGGSGTSKNILLSTLYRYNTGTTTLQLVSDNLPAGEYYNLMTSYINEESDTMFYFWGGQENHSFYRYILNNNTTEIYNPITESWNIVGISEDSQDIKQLFIYPNPAEDRINIKMGKTMCEIYSVKIYDISGQLIAEKSYSDHEISVSFDICSFTSGIYLVEINNIYAAKFTKK